MPHAFADICVHLVFGTRGRRPHLHPEMRPRLHAWLAGAVRAAACVPYQVGGHADHIHILLRLHRTQTISDLVQDLKVSSARWMKSMLLVDADFHWQVGYGAFSVSRSALPQVAGFIARQEEIHATHSFREEMAWFERRHGAADSHCDGSD
jgi:putative transposase